MLANAAAMNYGFAFRLATYAGLRRSPGERSAAARAGWSSTPRTTRSTRRRSTARPAVVHRHNSCRAYPAERMPAGTHVRATTGQAVLLPGTNRTSSYLAVAGAGAHRSLHSACHGAGTVVAEYAASGRSGPHPAATGR